MPSNAKPESPSKLIDARIEELADWRGEVLARMRRLVKQAVPDVVEPSSPASHSDHATCCNVGPAALVQLRDTFALPVDLPGQARADGQRPRAAR